MEIENNSPEIQTPNAVPPENPVPPVPQSPAVPPAATLATQGEVTDERALELQRRETALQERERKAREIEEQIARRELTVQQREQSFGREQRPAKKPAKKPHWSDPVFSNEEEEQ